MKTALSDILDRYYNVQFACLFGSYADGTQNESSDVDIAVYVEDTSLDSRLALHHELQKVLRKDIDLVVLNDVKNIYLLEAILDQGIVLKEHEDRAYYEVMKQHEIIDFKNFRRYIDAA
jgi:predicted nucleotidyltransferase